MNHTDFAGGYSAQLAFDLVVFVLTFTGSYRLRRSGTQSIANIMYRDGISISLSSSPQLTPATQALCILRVLKFIPLYIHIY